MKKKFIKKAILVAMTMSMVLPVIEVPMVTKAATNVTENLSDTKQVIRGFG